MSRIIILRHGESVANTNKDILSTDDSPLTELGKIQAQKTGIFLKENYKIKKVVSSELLRAKQTADIIAEELGVKQVARLVDLKEGDNGILKGTSKADAVLLPHVGSKIAKLVNIFENTSKVQQTKRDKRYIAADHKMAELTGGESTDMMKIRAKRVWREIFRMKSAGDILVVSHNGFISIMLSVMYNMHDAGIGWLLGKDKNGKEISNCHISVIGPDRMLELQRYTRHLDKAY